MIGYIGIGLCLIGFSMFAFSYSRYVTKKDTEYGLIVGGFLLVAAGSFLGFKS